MKRIYAIIITIEIIALIVLIAINSRKQEEIEQAPQQQVEQEELESIFTALPYKSEGFSVYYFLESNTFTVQINDIPYDRNLEDALVFLNTYQETKDFTEEDVRIVKPSYMY